MNAPVIVLLVATVFAWVWIFRARTLDRWDEFHLMHGPNSGCPECAGK
ncbi:hypothetical protein ArV2_gp40 [Arthrobacter phage vB_ArS-ArV2]|uniref:Uncharacterized protein n=1 Tax=Arthrobacter phage vB_ArS-ArV2 TaxID=1414742 RepID=V5R8S4_9CAUD|nr:hypothetical protein ArV2_gp40 [Arthrobacter phage vB_ArS-ArV2]AHB31651.1 hypothetical protein ArV2_gp40 [Arthrobacter phage vB_ArS-ArV2]